ncbi:hypothetical protein ACWD2L_00385 [Streptomyces sp. NPDC002754]
MSRGIPKPYKACSCRVPGTKRLMGKRCPRLPEDGHGGWYARYESLRLPDGRRRQPRTGPYESAEACAQALAHMLLAGPLVNEILDNYLMSLACAPRTRENYRRSLLPVRELIGDSPARRLTEDDVQDVTDYLSTCGGQQGNGLSKRTVNSVVCLLRAAYEQEIFQTRLKRRVLPVAANPGVIPL